MQIRIKQVLSNERTFYITLLLLVSLTAYGLGLQAGELRARTDISSDGDPVIIFSHAPDISTVSDSVSVTASKSGTKYYFKDCAGAANIKEKNLIRFESESLAQAAGYDLAKGCSAS